MRGARHAGQEEEQRRMGSRREEEEHGRRGRDAFEKRVIARVARHARQEERRREEERMWGSRREEEEQGRSRRHEEGLYCYMAEFPPLPSPGNRRRGAGPMAKLTLLCVDVLF